MINSLILILIFMVSEIFTDFYAGRIKPGKYEYPKLNGWMLVEEARALCEKDLACGGFTFKGSYKTLTRPMEMYFFHIVPQKAGTDYFYWSTYEVDRKFVKLSKVGMKSEMKHSIKHDVRLHGKVLEDVNLTELDIVAFQPQIGIAFSKIDFEDVNLTELDIVAFQPQIGIAFSKIDFEDFVVSNNSTDVMILNLNLKNMIDHTYPKIDRCCKLKKRNITYDGIDNMKRIHCNISKEEFTKIYVNQRESIMMKGCQTNWKAKNWTIENLLNRYNNISVDENEQFYFQWQVFYQKTINGPLRKEKITSNQLQHLINAGFFVKVFLQLPKKSKGWIHGKRALKTFGLELLDEYEFPEPMPEDKIYDYHVDTNQAYLMLATEGTGSKMHIDPWLTDAFNALIIGEKWWVSLPKDLYEFKDEFMCDSLCSDVPENFHHRLGGWFIHILPQIRNRIFFGQKLKSFLQRPGETLYMPNVVLHTVWNVSPSLAIGDNPLYETSFDEWMGSEVSNSDFIRDRIILKARQSKSRIMDIIEQVDDAIVKNRIVNFTRPDIAVY